MSHSFRLGVEALEDRQCLSTMLNATLQGHNLKITGNDEWNVVQVTQDDASNTLTVVFCQLPHTATQSALIVNKLTFKSSEVNRITVDLGLGNDNFEYCLASGTDLLFAKDLSIDMGAGDDCVTIDTAAAALASAASLVTMPDVSATDGVLTADGTIISIPQLQPVASISSLTYSTIRNTFNVDVNTGAGNDSVCVCTGSLQSKIKSTISVDLGSDQDQFWLSNEGTVNKNATLTFNITGNDGKDALYAGSYGDVFGTLNLNVNGGNDDDSILVDIQGLQQGKTVVNASGGFGDDMLILNALPNPLSSGQFTLAASGDSGNDTAYINGSVALSGLETWLPLV